MCDCISQSLPSLRWVYLAAESFTFCCAQLVTRGEIIPHLRRDACHPRPPSLPPPPPPPSPSILFQKSLSPPPQSPSPPLPLPALPKPRPPATSEPRTPSLLPRSLLFTRLKRRPDAIPSLGGKESLACSDYRLAADNRILPDISSPISIGTQSTTPCPQDYPIQGTLD
jgi:hypothetical protein